MIFFKSIFKVQTLRHELVIVLNCVYCEEMKIQFIRNLFYFIISISEEKHVEQRNSFCTQSELCSIGNDDGNERNGAVILPSCIIMSFTNLYSAV